MSFPGLSGTYGPPIHGLFAWEREGEKRIRDSNPRKFGGERSWFRSSLAINPELVTARRVNCAPAARQSASPPSGLQRI
jgi:hypothetical protein